MYPFGFLLHFNSQRCAENTTLQESSTNMDAIMLELECNKLLPKKGSGKQTKYTFLGRWYMYPDTIKVLYCCNFVDMKCVSRPMSLKFKPLLDTQHFSWPLGTFVVEEESSSYCL